MLRESGMLAVSLIPQRRHHEGTKDTKEMKSNKHSSSLCGSLT
jgi:hypothetical protein